MTPADLAKRGVRSPTTKTHSYSEAVYHTLNARLFGCELSETCNAPPIIRHA